MARADLQEFGEESPRPESASGVEMRRGRQQRKENEAASMLEASSNNFDSAKSLRAVTMTITIPIIAAMIAMAALIVSPMNSRFDSIDSRFAQNDDKFARLEAKIDANTQRIVAIESKLERLANMTILAHGNGEITSDELALIWETAGGE